MKYILGILFSLCVLNAQSQGDEKEHHHHHHKNEIGMANAPVYFLQDDEFAYGIHFHYVRKLTESKFGIGLGYERIFDDHEHNTFSLVGDYRPIEAWSINVSPGVTYESRAASQLVFSLHIETAYEFELGDFHIGPAAEWAYDTEDIHISLGIHIGYGF
ncbi:MAG: hypothetical protein KDC83_12160 [Flavobacteriales bacterium]|nr:hypothetical protein [Flavobacteriales bacterium]